MNSITPVELLKSHLLSNDYQSAIIVACGGNIYYGKDASIKKAAQIAKDCIKNKSFYLSIGTNIDLTIEKAIEALKSKFL
jgi:hypothetical protein